MGISRVFRNTTAAAFGGLAVLAAAPSLSAISVANTPLFLAVTVPPNITLTLDDSGSMRRAFVPENCLADTSDCAHLDNRYEKSAYRNLIHYDPNVKYVQPKDAAGNAITTTFAAAKRNGYDATWGTINLGTQYRPTASLDFNLPAATENYMGHFPSDSRCTTTTPYMCQMSNGSGGWITTTTACAGTTAAARSASCQGAHPNTPAAGPAYYYVFDPSNNNCNGTATDNDCYDLKIVSATSGPGTRDLNGDGVVSALDRDERQNFANWYSFARSRSLATSTAASLAFATLDPAVRVAWHGLNSCRGSTTALVDTDCDGWKNNFTNFTNAMRPFTGAHKNNFYAWVQQQPTNGGTPLPEAMARVGEYYRTGGENGPYDNNYSTANSGEHSCRRNYHIMMTDGLWTVDSPVGNVDNSTIVLPVVATEPDPDITQYTPRAPYRDTSTDTLADVAMRYYMLDLRPTLANNITPVFRDRVGTATEQYWNPRNDPASWQHMVNFTIGLGLTGFLGAAGLTWTGDMYSGSYPQLQAGTQAWPVADQTTNNPGNVADLWHAAINSRGRFFSADNPAALSGAFQQVLTAISGDSGASAALSTNSTSIQPGISVVYQAKFNRDWSGTLLALPIGTGGVVGAPIWDASQQIPAHDQRKIYTWNGLIGVEFRSCGLLSASQQLALDTNSAGTLDLQCPARLAWLRGDDANEEKNGGTFRTRANTVMGDVINSDPAYVKNIDYGYRSLPVGTPGQSSYNAYLNANASRTAMVYVGSNDGKLYGIDGTTGVESFAYVPGGVYANLSHLTDPVYTHRYYADGAITVGDVYAGVAWKTLLVAGLNAGGNSIYALDVTDPDSFDENEVRWEYTESDLGMTFSQPQIGILESGEWVVVFGNGYNSAGGGSYLYIVDAWTGTLIRKIRAVDNAGDDNNGLSTPLLYDSDNDRLIDAIYAGDLQGNMWKFDVSSSNPASWDVAFAGAPLFRARNASGQVQPITAQPKVGGHPLGGHMVVFGTGRYLTTGDPLDLTAQTFYGIRDNGAAIATTNRSELQVQTMDLQVNAFNQEVRSVTGNSPNWAVHKGWYLDLLDPPTPPGTARGERVVSTPIIKHGRVIFVTVVPSTDPCLPGGTSWLMELDLATGGTFSNSVLDLNNDGMYDENDTVGGEVVSGVRVDNLGISKTPVWLDNEAGCGEAYKVMTGTSGGFVSHKNSTPCGPPAPPGGTVTRRSWIQIR